MIWNKQFKYPNSQRSIKGEYDISKMLLPSVTTVLNATQPEDKRKSLDRWIALKGEDEATRIKELAGRRGTAMHFYLQKHLDPDCKGYMDMTTLGQVAEPMAKKIIEKGLNDLTEVWGSEVVVHYPGLYAGATDLVGIYDYSESIVDFKQSNKPKRGEWIGDYFTQLGAYAMAHNYVYGTKIDQGVILMCTPDCYFQKFVIRGKEFVKHQHNFLRRLDQYYEEKK
jgi:genome maintenance exonuclease 1